MGSGIAAHFATAGIDVVLLDVECATAAAGVARQQKVGGFMDAAFAERTATGSVEDDLPLLADADWTIEAVAERLRGSLAASVVGEGSHKRYDGGNPMNLVNVGSAWVPLPACDRIALMCANLFTPELR